MSRKQVTIVSLKYSPGLKKFFVVLGDNLRQRGFGVTYLLSAKYANDESPAEESIDITSAAGPAGILRETAAFIVRPGEWGRRCFPNPPDFVCFYNPHPLNVVLARAIRSKYPQALTAVYFHEPFMPDKAAFGTRRAMLIRLVESVQARVVKNVRALIAPSDYARKKIRVRFPKFHGPVYLAPLLARGERPPEVRRPAHFSMVGMANNATGHREFFGFVNHVAARGGDLRFCVVSSSNLEKYAVRLRAAARNRVDIIHRPAITDREIDVVIRGSYAVFRLDKSLTQSAVLVDAFRNGTPVIARDIPGLRQHVRHKENGYILPSAMTNDDLWRATGYVRENFEELSRNARADFERLYHENNFGKYYSWLIDHLGGKG